MHNIPISTFTALKHLISLLLQLYRKVFDRTEKQWFDNELNTDTVMVYRAFNYSYSLSASTKIYGIVNFKNKRVKAIRHIHKPSISLSYSPDFSSDNFNFYDEVQIDTLVTYSNTPTIKMVFTELRKSIEWFLRFSLGNILEMKALSKDTVNPIKN